MTMEPAPALDLDGPVPIAVDIARLLGSMPPPIDPAALIPWLSRKADLFDRIAAATADPGLADNARAVADADATPSPRWTGVNHGEADASTSRHPDRHTPGRGDHRPGLGLQGAAADPA